MAAVPPRVAELPHFERVQGNINANNVNNADGNNGHAGGRGDEPAMDLPQALKALDDIQFEFNHYNHLGLLSLDFQSNILARRAEAIARIPNFWRQALVGLHCEHFHFRGQEPECLSALISIDIESLWSDDLDIKKEVGCQFKFTFGPNPYFDNRELVKEYKYEAKRPPRRKSCTRIEWNRGATETLAFYDWGLNWASPFSFFDWYCEIRPMRPFVDNDIAFRIKNILWRDPLLYYNHAAR
ncbi:unnamed protein product [Orchesella dallaii]|uniref:Uncharacterized protein n=1 Tax=Orchesella dallaii TaxID=48710 RepID=A0ABP1RF32_9HEXA